ncbi:MAG: hypothetical protein CVU54_07750 [Deltaproteobacteria bacterium HGW-Deltaproteobacteria-12]|nr:MAG: hypothetical protein CVU54_07750 [Deltaproteobacteria bacterium HGW-Deltaproteobacteria-12]
MEGTADITEGPQDDNAVHNTERNQIGVQDIPDFPGDCDLSFLRNFHGNGHFSHLLTYKIFITFLFCKHL